MQSYGTGRRCGEMQSLWKLSQRMCYGNVDERLKPGREHQQLEKRERSLHDLMQRQSGKYYILAPDP